ncbi:MAG: DUF559 domain-containing protein [Microbacteriaceae bacterium]
MQILDLISAHGGLAATHELLASGVHERALTWYVREGIITRVRQGWYTRPELAPLAQQAIRVGGRLGCASGLSAHGIWTVDDGFLHVRTREHDARLRTRSDPTRRLTLNPDPTIIVHWQDPHTLRAALGAGRSSLRAVPHPKPPRAGDYRHRIVSPVEDCLADMIHCEPDRRFVLAAAESAMNKRLITVSAWKGLVDECDRATAAELSDFDTRMQSGIETITRIGLRHLNVPIQCQMPIPSVGRVDFLIGECLVIEVDGAEYHTDPEKFERDRERDATLSALGYRCLRFSYRQVMFGWPQVLRAIEASIHRGDHLRAR